MEKLGDAVEPINTYKRGHKPIDTILCTRGIVVEKAGYLPFGEGVGDHRALFIDVTIASILGVNLPPDKAASARRINLQDPRIVTKYVKNQIIHVEKIQERHFLEIKKSNAKNHTGLGWGGGIACLDCGQVSTQRFKTSRSFCVISVR